MCAPAAAAAAPMISSAAPWLAGAQGVSGLLGAVGGFMGESEAAAAENQQRIDAYKNAMAQRAFDWAQTTDVWNSKRLDYKLQKRSNNEAYVNLVAGEQRKLNETNASIAYARQNQLMQLAQEQGTAQARNIQGNTAQRLMANPLAQAGRNDAMLADQMLRARYAFSDATREGRNKLMSANNQAWSQVSVAPKKTIAPPKPVLKSGPNALSLISGIADAGIGAFGTYTDLLGTAKTLKG